MREVRCPLLVGRDRDLEAVLEAVDAAARGRGGVVVVLGEAGVGKSRLAATGATAAAGRGMAVLRGRAAPSPAPAPFRPLTEALLSALRGQPRPSGGGLAGYEAVLPVLVPAWAAGSGDVPAEPSVILLGEAALALLGSIAAGSGAFVLLEDLHWSDAGTLELLDYLADKVAGTGVLMVATARAGEGTGVDRLARQLAAQGHCRTIELRRLPAAGVRTMVAAVLGELAPGPVPEPVVALVERVSDGLPFLVEEVLASMVASGSLRAGSGGWEVDGPLDPLVPPSFASMVNERMERLSPAAAAVVQAAAVLGERFEWDLLAAAVGRSPDAVAGALREAANVQLVDEDRASGAVRFRHALTRLAVLDTLLMPQRAAVSRRALAALEKDAATASDPARLALAAELAQTAGDHRRATALLVASAEAALRTGAVSAARVAAERVVAQAADHDQAVRGHELLLDASVRAGDARQVVEIGERLLAQLDAGRAGDARRAEAHLRLAGAAVAATDWRRAREHLTRVASHAPDASGELGARRELAEAHVALGEHRLADAGRHAEAAHRAAADLGDADLRCEALELLGRVERVRASDTAARHFAEALVVAEGAGLQLRRVRALHELGTIELFALAPPVQLRAARDGAVTIGAPGLAAQAAMHLAVAHFVRFEVAEGRAAVHQAIEEAERFRLGLLFPAAVTVLGAIEAVTGNTELAAAAFDRARPHMDDEIEATGRGHVLALAAVAVEDRATALRELAHAERLCPPHSGVARSPYRGLQALLLALDPAAPTTVLDHLTAEEESLHVATRAQAQLARAVLAGRAGDHDRARDLVAAGEAALVPAPWYRNVALRYLAEAALADGWGEPDRWLREALDFFTTAGLNAPARACRSLLRRAGAPVPRRTPGRAVDADLLRLGVTDREADVLALLSEGRSNRDIAERLYLSTRTVEKHVERLLMKTGAANRAQLAAWAARTRRPGT